VQGFKLADGTFDAVPSVLAKNKMTKLPPGSAIIKWVPRPHLTPRHCVAALRRGTACASPHPQQQRHSTTAPQQHDNRVATH
jgi:hypothetical protein